MRSTMPIRSSIRRAIPLILVGFLSSTCATLISCNMTGDVDVYGFDVVKGWIYLGPKNKPQNTVSFQDKAIEQYISMSLSDWTSVRTKLATCH